MSIYASTGYYGTTNFQHLGSDSRFFSGDELLTDEEDSPASLQRSQSTLITGVEETRNPVAINSCGEIWRLKALSNGKVATASYDHWTRLHKIETLGEHEYGQTVQSLSKARKAALCLLSLSDGTFLSGSADRSITHYSPDGAVLSMMKDRTGNGIYSLAKISDTSIATGECHNQKKGEKLNHKIKIWDITSKRVTQFWNAHFGGISNLSKLDDFTLASASGDGAVCTWDLRTQEQTSISKFHTDYVYAMTQPDTNVLLSGGRDRRIQHLDLATLTPSLLIDLERSAHESTVYDLQSLDPVTAVSASRDRTVKVWDLRSRSVAQHIDVNDGYVYSAAFTPDGTKIVAGTSGESVSIIKGKKAAAQIRQEVKKSGQLHVIDRRV
ncbi:MAG: WD40 repeat domain-containing protein [Chlamydiia bacterium]